LLYQESLAIKRELSDKRGIAGVLYHLGNVARRQGGYGRAAALYKESLTLYWGMASRGLIQAVAFALQETGAP
jgi:tetratricopeptide repeat protein